MSLNTLSVEEERAAASSATQIAERPTNELRRVIFPYRPVLDVVRFLAAIWVMLSHTGAVKGGGHAVSIFFVLSGYLIGGQLVDEKRRRGGIEIPEFYFKRITRIWIPYFIVLAGFIALFLARRQDSVPGFYGRMFGAVTYTYNLVNSVRGNIHPTWVSFNQIWSLSVEEQFYLVVPLLIRWIPMRLIVPVSVLLTIQFLLRFPPYAGLSLGVLLAAASERRPSESLSPQRSALLGAIFVAFFAVLFAVGQSRISPASWITYLISGIVVLLADRIPLPRRTHNGLRYLGLMTYSYYLIHGLPAYFLGALYRRVSHSAADPVWLNIAFGLLALPLSFLFVRWIELPVLRIRGDMLKVKSPWIPFAPWLAWGLSSVGLIGLVYFALH